MKPWDRVPGRPEHPDFLELAEVILWFDGESDEGGRTYEEIVTEFRLDPRVALYMAGQRSLIAARHGDLPMTEDLDSAMVGMWLEGLWVGMRLQRQRQGRKPS